MTKDVSSNYLLTIDDVMRLTGYKSPSTIYRLIHRQDGFPQPVALGGGRVRWRSSEIELWLQNLPSQTYS